VERQLGALLQAIKKARWRKRLGWDGPKR